MESSRIFGAPRGLLLLALFIAASCLSSGAQNQRPKLVVGIVVEDLRYEMLQRHRSRLLNGGFYRLMEKGTSYDQAYYRMTATGNAPGMATLMTGSYPNRHGVVGEEWYDDLEDRMMHVAESGRLRMVNGKVAFGNYAPEKVMTQTMNDVLKLFYSDSAKTMSIGMNPVSSVMAGGHMADYAFWFDDKTGNWVTGHYYTDSMPQWVHDFNDKELQDVYIRKSWFSYYPLDSYTRSDKDESDFEPGFVRYRNSFPYELKYLKNRSGNYKYIKFSPYGNTYTKDFALAAIEHEQLGQDEFPDLLMVNFSAMHYLNPLFGPRSVEAEDILLRLDMELEHLIDYLDNQVGHENILVFLTSDSGVSDNPEFLRHKMMNGGRFDGEKSMTLLNTYLSILFGKGEWIKAYHHNNIYLNQALIDQSNELPGEIQQVVADFMTQFKGVAYSLPAYKIKESSYAGGVLAAMQNAFYANRSGDVVVCLEPGWIDKDANCSTAGSPYNYDTHVPLVFYGGSIAKNKRIHRKVELIDVAPTVNHALFMSPPDAASGKVLYDMFKDN